jgi:DNA-binding transcriptional regulator PaaX
MKSRDVQIAETLAGFSRDFGTSENTVKAAARRMKISDSVANSAARTFETASEPARDRQIRESAERTVERANAAEAKGLRSATLQELETLAALTYGRG